MVYEILYNRIKVKTLRRTVEIAQTYQIILCGVLEE